MKVLVTGATGTIGANVVKRLVESRYEVRAQVRPGSRQLPKIQGLPVEIRPADLLDREALGALVEGVDAVVHLAAMVPKAGADTFGYVDVNIAATAVLLEAARRASSRLTRFVYASSTVLFPQEGFRTDLFVESDKKTRPVGMYAVSKLAGEILTHSFSRGHGLPTVILNVPETFCGRELLGERLRSVSPFTADHVVALEALPPTGERDSCLDALRRHEREGRKLLIALTPEGRPWRRHLGDVRDVVTACILALHEPKAVGESFVVMSDALDYGVGVPYLAELTGMRYAQEIVPFGNCYWYDMRKTQELLGYRSAYDSRRMLEDAWRHARGEDIGIIDGTDYPRIER